MLYRDEDETVGYWELVTMAAALAASTTRLDIGHSVLNGPYRSPALVAKIAETLDEVSGGRYILGIGRGNVPDHDYAAFGFTGAQRTARLAEALQIIRGLLKDGRVDFEGEHWFARESELVMRGPRPGGPPSWLPRRGRRCCASPRATRTGGTGGRRRGQTWSHCARSSPSWKSLRGGGPRPGHPPALARRLLP